MKNNISSTLVVFEAKKNLAQNLIDFLDLYFPASSLNYLDNGKQEYIGYADLNFDEQDLKNRAEAANVTLPNYKIETIKDKNWLLETFTPFEPFETNDFCIYGTFEKKAPKTNKIPLRIDAKTAFGSTHQTTKMCLDAISDLAKLSFDIKNALDIGTGSGILAIASAKYFSKNKPLILAVDIDRESISVAERNIRENRVHKNVCVLYSNGYRNKKIKNLYPYDLIMANIFARPLISMAKKTAAHLREGGYAVLSGFTKNQKSAVFTSYEKLGFKLIKSYEQNNWCTFLLQKKETLQNIQNRLQSNEALLIARNNMFLNEDVLNTENKIFELTNFSGSAGLLLVSKSKTFLLVDGRYTLQAKKQVSKEIEVIESSNFYQDVVHTLKKHHFSRLNFNPWCFSENAISFLKKNGIETYPDENAPKALFIQTSKIFLHTKNFAGLSSKQKSVSLAKLIPSNFDALLITSAEEISWLCNLRAYDLPTTPILRAYGLLYKNGILRVYQPDKFTSLINDLSKCKHVLYSKSQTPVALLSQFPQSLFEDIGFDQLSKMKLQKNEKEMQGFRRAHIRDGVALVKFLYWLDNTNKKDLTELDIVQKLHVLRSKQKNYFSESFETIAAVNQNAAVVHYSPTKKTNKKLPENGILLIDSGAQYFDGTTDITRTIAFGKVSDEIKTSFTEVLKAHIALSSYQFKEGLRACELDQICRNILIKNHKDYKHGTGHSVGHFSNVHEAPFAINPKNQMPVLENYVTSIEPGYYKENAYGIRIENLVYVKKSEKKGYLCFENLTLCPIEQKLIKKDFLTSFEKEWLNNYHQEVFENLKPYLRKNEIIWLQRACEKI